MNTQLRILQIAKTLFLCSLPLFFGACEDGKNNTDTKKMNEMENTKTSQVLFQGNPIELSGELPSVGSQMIDATLMKSDLSKLNIKDLRGKKLILNIFPSLDTGVCAASVIKFNNEIADIPDAHVICISRDLPFAINRFCATEGIENVISVSDFSTGEFGKKYGIEIKTDPLTNLLARAIVVIDEKGKIIYTELVPEISQAPDYEKALAAVN